MLAPHGLADARAFAEELLRPLLHHDDEHGSRLVETLRAFLEHGAKIRATGRALGVHENTVRHRMGRIRNLSRIDADDLETLVDARFALRLYDLLAAGLSPDPGPAPA